jgi:hypothetical protein
MTPAKPYVVHIHFVNGEVLSIDRDSVSAATQLTEVITNTGLKFVTITPDHTYHAYTLQVSNIVYMEKVERDPDNRPTS